MKAVILAGGYGTRLSEETGVRPKPMVEIGEMPILWHIMKIYSAYGINDFIICLGYKSHMIKEFFATYLLKKSDVTFDLQKNDMKVHQNNTEPWRVTLIDTGGRLKRVKRYIGDETFCFTYGDGVTNLNIQSVIEFHRSQKTLATLTAVQPPGRFGAFGLKADQKKISTFKEKPKGDVAWINGGFFVLEPEVMQYISDDTTVWEKDPLENLARDGNLAAYKHKGFWQPMDSLRDKNFLEELWQSGTAPWKIW
jgi:glucose-1-phosphate cytidylyltransferase